jgi:hypothetical protein
MAGPHHPGNTVGHRRSSDRVGKSVFPRTASLLGCGLCPRELHVRSCCDAQSMSGAGQIPTPVPLRVCLLLPAADIARSSRAAISLATRTSDISGLPSGRPPIQGWLETDAARSGLPGEATTQGDGRASQPENAPARSPGPGEAIGARAEPAGSQTTRTTIGFPRSRPDILPQLR